MSRAHSEEKQNADFEIPFEGEALRSPNTHETNTLSNALMPNTNSTHGTGAPSDGVRRDRYGGRQSPVPVTRLKETGACAYSSRLAIRTGLVSYDITVLRFRVGD